MNLKVNTFLALNRRLNTRKLYDVVLSSEVDFSGFRKGCTTVATSKLLPPKYVTHAFYNTQPP